MLNFFIKKFGKVETMPVSLWGTIKETMTNTISIQPGTILKLKRDAVMTFGDSEKNPIVSWEVDQVNEQNVSFTFKGKKSEYRLNGMRIYAITGPTREYIITEVS